MKPSTGPKSPTFHPIKLKRPRTLPKHAALSPSLEDLYARSSGAWVEGAWGTIPATELAAVGSTDELWLQSNPKGVEVAMAGGPLPVLSGLPTFALAAPTAADTQPSVAAQVTPEIQALADKLGHDPLNLYNYVHDHIRTTLYYGSAKGADGTLQEMAGNDADQASLLVALLRASGVPARYEYANVTLTGEQVRSMLGFETAQAAVDALAYVGYRVKYEVKPVATTLPDGTQVTQEQVALVHMERVFVRAYVPYGDYRGTGPGTGRHIWVRLDPAVKRTVSHRTANLRGLHDLDQQAYLSKLETEEPEQVWEDGLLAAAKQKNVCTTLASGLWAPTPVKEHFQLLPAEHPGHVDSTLMVFDAMPQSLQQRVTVTVPGGTRTVPAVDLYGQALHLTFPGATAADRTAIGDDITKVKPYLVQVKPTVTVGGTTWLTGDATTPGTAMDLGVTLRLPAGVLVPVHHHLTAGGVFVVRLSTGTMPLGRVAGADKALEKLGTAAGRDAKDLGRLDAVVTRYIHNVETSAEHAYGLERYATVKDMVEAMGGRPVQAQYLYGLPVSLTRGAYTLDVARESSSPLAVDGDASQRVKLGELIGLEGSDLEHRSMEEVLDGTAVSAVRTIELAYSQGIPVETITSADAANIGSLVGYDDGTLAEMRNGVAAGETLTAPARTVDYGGFTGIEGYTLVDPQTGDGLYRLGASLNGAKSKPGARQGTGGACQCGGGPPDVPGPSTGRLSNGDMTEARTDLQLPAVGIPIVLSRTYRSGSPTGTAMGTKWGFSYGMRIEASPDGSLTYYTGSLQALPFTKAGTGSWSPPPGWHQTITKAASGGYAMRFKHGNVFTFDDTGRLVSEADANGNTVTLQYDATGQLHTVTDATGRVVLTFGFDQAGLIASVTDVAGRTVTFGHTGTDLTSATDVLGHTETYGYDTRHLMTSHTSKLGATVAELYDADGWWNGWVDALGDRGQVIYDVPAHQAVSIDPLGNETVYQWNDLGSTVKVIAADGEVTTNTWDADRNKLSTTDSRGNTTAYTYDTKGNMLTRTDALGEKTRYTYDPIFSQLKTRRSPDGS